jgi:hypothetical protein
MRPASARLSILLFVFFLLGLCLPALAAEPWDALAAAVACRDPTEARKQLEALLLDQPGFLAGHFNLGLLLMESDPDAAAKHFEPATASPQADQAADAWHNLALVRWQQGRLEDAVTAASKAAGQRPDEGALRDELRRAYFARQDEARRQAEEEAKKLHLGETNLPTAHVGEAYDHRILAQGGGGGYRFSLGTAAPANTTAKGQAGAPTTTATVATPPAGLALETDGQLHGTPTTPGHHDLPLVVKDVADASITGTVSLDILPAPAITTAALPEGVVGQPYHAELACVGLDQPAWSAEGLPAGIALAEGRGAATMLDGTTEKAGDFPVRLAAGDGQRRAERTLSLTVSDLFAPDRNELPPATAWAAYQHQVGVRGPAQGYRWSAAPKGGLAIAADGTVSGTPDQAGAVQLPVTITADDGRHRDATLTVPVNPPPVIKEGAPIELAQGQPVNRPLAVVGGTPPYRWSVEDGVLPAGVRLDPDGALRGAPLEPCRAEVTVGVEDRWQAATRQKLTIVVKPADQPPPQTKNEKPDDQKDQKKKDDQKKQDGQKDQKQPDRQPQAQGDQKEGDQKQTTEAQAQILDQAATDRWLEHLPKEERERLRYQLLEGAGRPRQHGNPW